MAPRIQIIVGSTRPGRFADKPVAWLVDRLTDRADLELDVLDLRDYPLPLFDSAMSPARSLREYPNEEVATLGRRIDSADGYIALTSEYNHGYPAVAQERDGLRLPGVQQEADDLRRLRQRGWGEGHRATSLVTVEFEMAPLRRAVHIFPD